MTQTERKQIAEIVDSLLCWDGMAREYLLTTPAADWDQQKYDTRACARDEQRAKLRQLGIDII